jgi:HAD superfamily hydrolase (TIGR01509 family)
VIITEAHIIRKLLYPIVSKEYPNITYNDIKKNYLDYVNGKIENIEEALDRISIDKEGVEKIMKKFKEALEVDKDFNNIITYLKSKYNLVIFSDNPKDLGKYLTKTYKFDKIFSLIFFSGDYGVNKDDLGFYEIVSKKINSKEIYFIDDKLNVLKKASSFGWKTIWMKREEQTYNFKPNYIITSLLEIKNILGGEK